MSDPIVMLSAFLEDAQDGPWKPEPPDDDEVYEPRRGDSDVLWLVNDAGDLLAIRPDTAAMLVDFFVTRSTGDAR